MLGSEQCCLSLPLGRWPSGEDAGPSFPLTCLPLASQGCGRGLEARTGEQAGRELVLRSGSFCLASSSLSPWPAVTLSCGIVLLLSSHSSHWGVGFFFFFFFNEAIPAPLSGATRLDSFQTFMPSCSQKFQKHRQLPTRHRPCSVATSACTFLVCIALSPRRQVTHVTWFSASSPLAVFTWGKEGHPASQDWTRPRAGNRPSQRLPTHL